MSQYRTDLPQLNGKLFLTDGGIETTLIFHEGFELPDFAAFHLLQTDAGRAGLQKYFRTYADIARDHGTGFILESATWRASPDWGERLGYSNGALADANRKAVGMLAQVRDEYETDATAMVVSGCVGPRGDGYVVDAAMSEDQAERYHAFQVEAFRDTDADQVTGVTMTYAAEAIGLTRAAQAAGMPVAVSFTVETDGRLPSGQPLKEAVQQVDDATGDGPAYYMINCAHPTHFTDALAAGENWTGRIRGTRANASTMSHAELDQAEELDDGNPVELAEQHRSLRNTHAHFNVFGGCCGTDHRHVEAICRRLRG